ncbi:MAG: hypothetical protein ABEI27_08545 [Halobellus sp.]|uniref:hypothetical protein n=1 Tax=Halobellus sp. TaxID=1979212 RepID=UPI0035D453EC
MIDDGSGSEGGLVGGVGHHFVRFVAVVIAVDAFGLGAWWLLPAGDSIRTGVLLGTLLVAPLLGFLLVYAPAVTTARERARDER